MSCNTFWSLFIYILRFLLELLHSSCPYKQERLNISILLSTPTKPSHKSRSFKPQTPRKKFINNGCSPNSAWKLIPKGPGSPQKKSKAYSIIKNTFGEPCYSWEQNLYWLNISLQLLYVSVYGSFLEFQEVIDTLQHYFMEDYDFAWFSQEHNTLWSNLCTYQIIENEFGFQSLFVSDFSLINEDY